MRLFILLSLLPSAVFAVSYYVAPTGADANAGDLAHPWRTIQKACNAATPGSTVYVRAGTYRERVTVRVSGNATAGYTTFQNYPNEKAIIDGTPFTAPADDSALVKIIDVGYVRFQGFEIRNYRSTRQYYLVAGILVSGHSHHLNLRSLYIHHIANMAAVDANLNGRDAHGLAVYGDTSAPITAVTIERNTISNCTLGSSEALVINGNVTSFNILNNTVCNNDNIGIDAIGWEATAPSNDQARYGLIRGNRVYNNSSFGNPAYGSDRSAGGIYVDGGRNITIDRNIVHHNDIGIEVASEHRGKTTTAISVRENMIYANGMTGLAFGGYDTLRGVTTNCSFTHNTLYGNDTTGSGTGEIMLQMAHDNIVRHNIVYCTTQNLLLSNIFTAAYCYNNRFDYNLYYGPGGAAACRWQWQRRTYTGFTAFRQGTGQDAHSLFADPLLNNPMAGDLHLRALSPAIDAGDPAFTIAAGERDFDGQARINNSRVDIGADERL